MLTVAERGGSRGELRIGVVPRRLEGGGAPAGGVDVNAGEIQVELVHEAFRGTHRGQGGV